MKRITIILYFFFSMLPMANAADFQEISAREALQIRTQVRELAKAGVPESAAAEMLTAMAQNRFSNQMRTQAGNIVADCVKAGLPHEPMMEKAMEGIAKGVSDQQVVSAMKAVAERYAHSYQITRQLKQAGQNTNGLPEIVAGCLASGMKLKDLENLAATISKQTKTKQNETDTALQAMRTARTMARRGIRSSTIEDVLILAVENQISLKAMEQLQHKERYQFGKFQKSSTGGNQGSDSVGQGGSGSSSGSGNGGSSGAGSRGGGGGKGSGGSGRTR